MKKVLVATVLIVLLAVVALEFVVIVNIFKAKQNLDNIGVVQSID